MRFLIKYLVLLFGPLLANAQDEKEEMISWDSNYKLTWDDYKAKPDPTSGAVATTTTYIGIEYNISPGGFSYKIQCRFSKSRSWGLQKTGYILSHEQGHFDIAEIFARKLHQAMNAYKFNKTTYQHDLKRIYENLMNGKEAMQNDYDRQTNHSINRAKQDEWLVKINRLLEEYKYFASYH